MYVVIAGGGVMGQSLAQALVNNRHDVVVIERDERVCEVLASRIGALVIRGLATDIDTLEDAQIARADVAVGALPSDADNIAFALLAKHFQVPRVSARMRNPRYEKAYALAGVDRSINVSQIFVRQLVLEIEQPELRQVATFGRGKAAIVVARLPEEAVVDGQTVKDVAQGGKFPEDCVIAGIFRKNEDGEQFIIPRGNATMRVGDQVFLAADVDTLRKAAALLQETRK